MPKRRKSTSITELNKILPVPIELDYQPVSSEEYTNTHITDVLVGDYHIVGAEEESGGSSYIVWCIRIVLHVSSHSSIVLYKRYSDIEKFRNQLVNVFHASQEEIPELPPKDNFSIQRIMRSGQWLEQRRKGLQWFMTSVLLNPKYQKSQVVTDFILS